MESGASSRSRIVIFSRPMSGRIAACLSRPPRASRRCVASAGNWLNVGSTGSHRPRPRAFVDVHLGPRVVVERAAHETRGRRRCARECRSSAPSRRRAPCARCSRRPCPQHLARRRQADGRLLVEQRVDVARQPLGARARAGRRRATRLAGLGANLRRVAFDERLRLQIARDVRDRAGRPRASAGRAISMTSPSTRLAAALQIRRRTGPRRRAAGAAAARRAARRCAAATARHDGRGLEQIGLHAAAAPPCACARSGGSRR